MEPDGSLPRSQEATADPYPDPDTSSPYIPNLFHYDTKLYPNCPRTTLVHKQHKGLWRQHSLDRLTK